MAHWKYMGGSGGTKRWNTRDRVCVKGIVKEDVNDLNPLAPTPEADWPTAWSWNAGEMSVADTRTCCPASKECHSVRPLWCFRPLVGQLKEWTIGHPEPLLAVCVKHTALTVILNHRVSGYIHSDFAIFLWVEGAFEVIWSAYFRNYPNNLLQFDLIKAKLLQKYKLVCV